MSSFLVVGTVTMQTKTILRAATAAAAIALAPVAASSATISSVQMTPEQLGAVTPQDNPLFDPVTIVGTVFENTSGSVSGLRRSPFDTAVDGDGEPSPNRTSGQYTSVSAESSASFTYQIVQTALSMIWGSPDTYNILTLSLGGSEVVTVVPGSTTGAPLAPQLGAWWFTIENVKFDKVTFQSTTNNALEFANYTTTPIPLPAAGWLLLTALGGLGVMARRRKNAAA